MNCRPSIELVSGVNRPNISFNGRLLYKESSTPEKRLEGLSPASQTLYIVISPLLFYGVDLLESIITDDSHILAVEQDPDIFDATLKFFDKAKFPKTRYINLNDFSLVSIINSYGTLGARRTVAIKLNLGYMLNRKIYDNFVKDASAALQRYWKNRITTIHMGRLWCKNIFHNLPHLVSSSSISDIMTEKPVVSVGAGESLEYSIDFLKKNRKMFFLTAADTAVTTLLTNGITPDLVIVLESQHANIYDFYSSDALSIPAAVDLTSSPELIRKFTGPLYFFISAFTESPLFELLDKAGLLPAVIPPLGSVGIASLFLSSLLTKQNILYSGLDFSFIPDKYHASGAPSHILSMLNDSRTASTGFFSAAYSERRKKVTDKSGRIVFTDLVMLAYTETMKELTTGSNRFYDIGKVGISASPAGGFYKSAEHLLQRNTGEIKNNFNIDLQRDVYLSSPSERQERAISFLNQEIDNLDYISRKVVHFQNNRSDDDEIEDKLAEALRRTDYTWLFFPDTSPLPSSSNSFLKRFLYSAAWFKRQLQNTISQL